MSGFNRQFYAFNDSNPEDRGYTRIFKEQASDYNEKGYGIFWTVNSFRGDRRIENLSRINSWFADLDNIKPTVSELCKLFYPSMIVETKSGFHVYVNCEDATQLNYKTICKRLTYALGVEKSVFDLARLLRVPGYKHLKDPSNPFLVREVFSLGVTYSEKQMLYLLPQHPDELKEAEQFDKQVRVELSNADSIFARIQTANQMELLKLFSGTSWVGFENYQFHRVSGGKFNITVNGKPANAWIDKDGMIGSGVGGGPTIANWLHYFGHSYAEVAKILEEVLR